MIKIQTDIRRLKKARDCRKFGSHELLWFLEKWGNINKIAIITMNDKELEDKSMLTSVMAMAAIRAAYGVVNFLAAYFIYSYGTVEAGLRINAIVGTIGPIFFTAVAIIGITGAAAILQPHKVIMIVLGIILIIMGTR